MLVFTVLCPKHGEEEEISLPESYTPKGYGGNTIQFEGDIPCNPSDKTTGFAVLHVKLWQGDGTFWLEQITLKPQ